MIDQENKNKIVSAGTTALALGLILVICLSFGYDPPDPPIPEEGVEVNLGNSDFGFGNNPDPSPSPASSAPRPASATEQISTQSTEATVPMYSSDNPAKSKTVNETPTTTKPEPPKEPEINTKALFSKSNKAKGNRNGGSEGITGGSGNQGKAGGDPNSKRYDGVPGKGGVGFKLSGRSAKALPEPQGGENREGKVVVKIWVDREGKVTRVEAPEKGSTLTEKGYVDRAKAAARKARFTAKDDAPEEQTGTITYIFRNN